jgi:hypothetical protein
MLLCYFLLLGPPGRALAQSGADPVSILIDEFEAVTSEIDAIQKGGPAMLQTALSNAVSPKFVELNFVERDKLNTILREKKLPEKLPKGSFDNSTARALKVAGANYVIFVKYLSLEKHVRLDARIVKVEKATGRISESDVFKLDELKKGDPFKILAEKLVNALYEVLGIPIPKSLDMLLPVFSYSGPKKWEATKVMVPQSLRTLLLRFKMQSTRLIAPPDMASTTAKSLADLAEMFPSVHSFIIGSITVMEVDQKLISVVNFSIIHRKGALITSDEIRCKPSALVIDNKVLEKPATKLKKDWESRLSDRKN